MGIITAFEYLACETSFEYHFRKYVAFEGKISEKAEKHLKMAVEIGKEFVGLGGYVSSIQKAKLKYLEEQLANR